VCSHQYWGWWSAGVDIGVGGGVYITGVNISIGSWRAHVKIEGGGGTGINTSGDDLSFTMIWLSPLCCSSPCFCASLGL